MRLMRWMTLGGARVADVFQMHRVMPKQVDVGPRQPDKSLTHHAPSWYALF